MARNSTPLVCLATLLAAACGDTNTADRDAGDSDAAATIDAGVPDAAPPDAEPPDAAPLACSPLAAPEVGAPCAIDMDCGTGNLCLNGDDAWPAIGYCTRLCAGDGDCLPNGECSNPIGGPGGTRVCVASCCDGADCAEAGHVCQDSLFGLFPLGADACLPSDTAAGDGDACAINAECAPSSLCINDPWDTPGGYCLRVGCTIGNDATCAPAGDGTCIDFDASDMFPPACVDTCAVDTDCRQSEGYSCLTGMLPTGVCIYLHADPGDACTTATDCGLAPWECLMGADFPGGYCGADGCDPDDPASCPGGSFCYDPSPGTLDGTEWCAQSCTAATDCRLAAGYGCIDLGGQTGCAVP
jgi:hypothetical protein